MKTKAFTILTGITWAVVALTACSSDETDLPDDGLYYPPSNLTQHEIIQLIEDANIFLSEAEQYSITNEDSSIFESVNIPKKEQIYIYSSKTDNKTDMFIYEDEQTRYEYEAHGIDCNGDGVFGQYKKRPMTDADRYWEEKKKPTLIGNPSKYTWTVEEKTLKASFFQLEGDQTEKHEEYWVILDKQKNYKQVIRKTQHKWGYNNSTHTPGSTSKTSSNLTFSYESNTALPHDIKASNLEEFTLVPYHEVKVVWGENMTETRFWIEETTDFLDRATVVWMNPSPKEIKGIFTDPVYQNELSGYQISIFSLDENKTIYVKL